jgi:CheY-like chemotaxis protein
MATNSSTSIAPKTVLVVEDSPTEAENIRAVLLGTGLQVVLAVDGPDGLQKVQGIHPDLIVMDVNMPGMNGFQVVRALKRDPQCATIPVVMLTTNDAPESVMIGLDSGVIDYIPKDVFAMRILVETIRQMGLI